MTYSRDWDRYLAKQPPSMWRDPARLGTAGAAVVAVVGAFLPWATGTLPRAGAVHTSGLDAPGDGVFMTASAISVLVLVSLRPLAEATRRLGRMVPVIVVAAMTLVWVQDYGIARRQVDAWLTFSGQAAIGLGLWLLAAGIFVMALGTVWMALRGPLEWPD